MTYEMVRAASRPYDYDIYPFIRETDDGVLLCTLCKVVGSVLDFEQFFAEHKHHGQRVWLSRPFRSTRRTCPSCGKTNDVTIRSETRTNPTEVIIITTCPDCNESTYSSPTEYVIVEQDEHRNRVVLLAMDTL